MTLADATDSWLVGQRVALGCALLIQDDNWDTGEWDGPLAVQPLDFVLRQLGSPVIATHTSPYECFLRGLPPTTLAFLERLPEPLLKGTAWQEHVAYWKSARTDQLGEGSKPGPLVAARVVADRIVNSTLSAAQIDRIARLEFGGRCFGWPDDRVKNAAALDALIRSLRLDRASGLVAIQSIRAFAATSAENAAWRLVVNDLFQRRFSWPLVTMERPGGQLLAYALPVDVKLDFTGVGDDVSIVEAAGVGCEGWRLSASKALAAAKALWRAKRHSWAWEYRATVQGAQAVLDLTTAGEVVLAQYAVDISLTDNSAGAYLGAALFTELVDNRRVVETTCATGVLSDAIWNDEGNSYVGAVNDQGLEAKVEYASEATFFDQMIVPTKNNELKKLPENLRIVRASTFTDYVDTVVGQEWHKHRYVRCPDLADAYKRRKDANTFSDEQLGGIIAVRNWLKAQPERIFELPEWMTPETVAMALAFATTAAVGSPPRWMKEDRAKKLQIFRADRASPDAAAQYAFVRVPEGQTPEHFWATVWEAIDGKPGGFEALAFAGAGTLGRHVAKQLDTARLPTPERPTRAPDLLVIVGYNRLSKRGGIEGRAGRRLHWDRVRPHLKAKLDFDEAAAQLAHLEGRLRHPRLEAQIGKTRILLVNEQDATTPEASLVIPKHLAEAVRRLSTFEHGFNDTMAGRMLDLSEAELTKVLADLTTPVEGRAALLVKGDAPGEYAFVRRPYKPADDAELQYRAADAITGLLQSHRRSNRLDVTTGSTARWRQDAILHIERAEKKASERYKFVHERLRRLLQPVGPSRLYWAVLRSSEEGADLWEALPRALRLAGRDVHPLDLLLVAKFAHKWKNRLNDPIDLHLKQKLTAERDRYLQDALRLCDPGRAIADEILDQDRIDQIRFVLCADLSIMLMADSPSVAGWNQASLWRRRAVELLHEGVVQDIDDPIFFEYIGDGFGVHGYPGRPTIEEARLRKLEIARDAAAWYRQGFMNAALRGGEKWRNFSTIVKWLGAQREISDCLHRDIDVPDDIMAALKSIATVPGAVRAYKRDCGEVPNTGLHQEFSVKRRWREGKRELERLWGWPPPHGGGGGGEPGRPAARGGGPGRARPPRGDPGARGRPGHGPRPGGAGPNEPGRGR